MISTVIRKSGQLEPFKASKIIAAVAKSAKRAKVELTDAEYEALVETVRAHGQYENTTVTTSELHELVLNALVTQQPRVYLEYRAFRNYKEAAQDSLVSTYEFVDKLTEDGYRENANKASELISTRMTLIAERVMSEMYMNFQVAPDLKKADDEGAIYIHDKTHLLLDCFNCCLFDLGRVLKSNFEINGIVYSNVNDIHTALTVGADVIVQASSNQFGGFSVSEVDYVFEEYCVRTYEKYLDEYQHEFGDFLTISQIQDRALAKTRKALEKGYLAFETKINTINNALGQTTFCTISFGRNTSFWGREISKTILKQRSLGLGEKHTTPLFPKLVFIASETFNTAPGSANYDLYQQALRCQRHRIYPDILSVDAGYVGDMYRKHGVVITPMG